MNADGYLRGILLPLVVIGCSPSSGTGQGPADASSDAVSSSPPGGGPGGGPYCQSDCCYAQPRGPCDEYAGISCTTGIACDGGLNLNVTLTCHGGSWTTEDACSVDGGDVATDGCPDSPPTVGSRCDLPKGKSCDYDLHCPDTGQPNPEGIATCNDGKWDTRYSPCQ